MVSLINYRFQVCAPAWTLAAAGARIIANIVISETTVYLLSIYDKSEKENLTDKELDELLKAIPK